MGSIYVVTGASRGIGLELCRQLARRGDTVVATVRDRAAAPALSDVDARVELLDVADPASVEAFAASLGDQPVDVLINNAGVYGERQALETLDEEVMRTCFEVNTLGPLRVTRALLSNLRAGRGRLIANMTSRMGSIEDNTSGGSYAYRVSKTALNMANRSLALDLAGEGFRCVVLHPDWVRTDMGRPSAPVSTPESAAGLLGVLDGLGPRDSGAFFDFRGERIPW